MGPFNARLEFVFDMPQCVARIRSDGQGAVRSDYRRLIIDPFTSTPHQPANACFAPSLLPNVAEKRLLQAGKLREIKDLLRKVLKIIDFRFCRDLGS